MRSDKFIGTASMVSIYGRNYNAFFKHVEINSSGQNSGGLPQLQQNSEVSYLFIYLAIMNLNS